MIRETVYMPDLATFRKLERRLFRMRRAGAKPEKVKPPPIGEVPHSRTGTYEIERSRVAVRTGQVYDAIRALYQPGDEVIAARISERTGIPRTTVSVQLTILAKMGLVVQIKHARYGKYHTYYKPGDGQLVLEPSAIKSKVVAAIEELVATGVVATPRAIAARAGIPVQSVYDATRAPRRSRRLHT